MYPLCNSASEMIVSGLPGSRICVDAQHKTQTSTNTPKIVSKWMWP